MNVFWTAGDLLPLVACFDRGGSDITIVVMPDIQGHGSIKGTVMSY